MKALVLDRPHDSNSTRILARLRSAEDDLKRKERTIRDRCAQLLKRIRHREFERSRQKDSQILMDFTRHVEEWKAAFRFDQEQKMTELIRSCLVTFMEGDIQTQIIHVVREVQLKLHEELSNHIISIRSSPDLEERLKSAFPRLDVVVDEELKRGIVVVHTMLGEMEYSWSRHLKLILDLI